MMSSAIVTDWSAGRAVGAPSEGDERPDNRSAAPSGQHGVDERECTGPVGVDEVPERAVRLGRRQVVALIQVVAGAEAAVDIRYDEALVEAVKSYQETLGLVADGVVGPATLGALGL